MGHEEFRDWAAAALGDPRQVYARKAAAPPDEPLVFMPDGEVPRFREAAKSGALICPVPACPSPRLVAREYQDRRDHFAHVAAPGDKAHGANYRKLATRRLLSEWAADQPGVAEVREEMEVEGIPIAVFARLADGGAVALCYVDGQLGADAWDEENRALRSSGLAVAWIFALRKLYFAPPEPAGPVSEDPNRTDLILDRRIYKRMRQKGAWPLLINLERQELANVVKPGGGPATRLELAPPVTDRVQHVAASPLVECRLCPYGIATPKIGERVLKWTDDSWKRR